MSTRSTSSRYYSSRVEFHSRDTEPYSRGAEQALSEKERSVEELEAAIKETPPRSNMTFDHNPSGGSSSDHGRTSSEPRPLGDVFDESEKMFPPGSPGLRHTRGRLESSKRSTPQTESFADVVKHELPSPPTTPSKSLHKQDDFSTPHSRTYESSSPSDTPFRAAKDESQSLPDAFEFDLPHTDTASYADIVKHEPESALRSAEEDDDDTDIIYHTNGTAKNDSWGHPASQGLKYELYIDDENMDDTLPSVDSNGDTDAQEKKEEQPGSLVAEDGTHAGQSEDLTPKSDTMDESYADVVKHDLPAEPEDIEASTEHESYADVVKHDPSAESKDIGAITDGQENKSSEEDFADTATIVSENELAYSFTGTGKDESPRSPFRKAHKKSSSRSLQSTRALQLALEETETLPIEIQGEEEDDQSGPLVYENYHSRSGTNLASIKLDPVFALSTSQRANKDNISEEQESEGAEEMTVARITKKDTQLVSGRRAGAGWAESAIRWAPLNVPLQRRLQTLAVLMHSLSIAGMLAFFFLLCTLPVFWPVLLPYLIYVLLSRAPTDGKLTHRSEWLRRSKFWSLFASYFPVRLHRTVELEPTRKYIFGYHPHGIISHGAFAAFTTEALGFGQLFPGITNSLLTLDSNFRVPLYRDWALRLGLASVSRESCENLLSKGGPNGEGMGRGITIVIGGARESLDAIPGTLNLVLKKRKGFVKLAVRTGADLVPVLAFGENDMYDQITSDTHPWIHKGQLLLKQFMGFTVPLFHARGIFNYDVGIMPYRRPINIVVGRPIRTIQSRKPDPAYVDELHKQYTDELLHIWEEWKDVFASQRNCELQIVE